MRSLRHLNPAAVAVVGLVIGVLIALRLLVVFDWDPSVFAAFGEDAHATTEYAEEKLGQEVLLRDNQGHDGKFFFVQSNDPWVLDPGNNAQVLDRPVYRSQRMLYPVLAGGGGFFSPDVIIWAMPIVNIVMLAVGTWAVSSIAQKHGISSWVGLAFALNIGLISELFIDGAGIVAFALAAVGALALEEDRTVLAAVAFAGSALTREVMAIFIAFVAIFWLFRKRVIPWAVAVPGAVAIAVWAIYLRVRIEEPPDIDSVQEITLTPFSGLIGAMTSGRASLVDYLVIGVFVVLIILVPYRAWRSDVYLTWGAAGFALLGPFLTTQVWQKSFDISRALAPLLTVFVLELFLSRNRDRQLNESLERTGVRS